MSNAATKTWGGLQPLDGHPASNPHPRHTPPQSTSVSNSSLTPLRHSARVGDVLGTDVGAMLGDAVGLTDGSMVGAHVIRMSGSKKSHGGVLHFGTTGPVTLAPGVPSSSSGGSHMSSLGSGISKSFGSSTMSMPLHSPPPLLLDDRAIASSAAVRARVLIISLPR